MSATSISEPQPKSYVKRLASNDWEIVLDATARWFNTNISVEQGIGLDIHATGNVTWSPGSCGNCSGTVGPSGTRPPLKDYETYHLFPMPEVGMGSLIMRIGSKKYAVGTDAKY